MWQIRLIFLLENIKKDNNKSTFCYNARKMPIFVNHLFAEYIAYGIVTTPIYFIVDDCCFHVIIVDFTSLIIQYKPNRTER